MVRHNQLWRDHLLAIAVREHHKSPYGISQLMVVHHPEDRQCRQVLDGYRRLLRDGDDTLLEMPLDRLVDCWSPLVDDERHQEWLAAFRLRYLELDKSGA